MKFIRFNGSGQGKPGMKKGFTLLELLIVMIILGVLVGMIFPVLGKMRIRARDIQCKNNLKQLHVAAMNYAYDNKGSMPSSKSVGDRDKDDSPPYWYQIVKGWVDWTDFDKSNSSSEIRHDGAKWWGEKGVFSVTNGTLWEYTGESLKVYVCPEFKRVVFKDAEGNPINDNNPIVRSYVMSQDAGGKDIRDVQASRRLLFADAGITNIYKGNTIAKRNIMEYDSGDRHRRSYDGRLVGQKSSDGEYPVESVGTYHNGKANAVFMDGHVEQITWDETTDACSGNW